MSNHADLKGWPVDSEGLDGGGRILLRDYGVGNLRWVVRSKDFAGFCEHGFAWFDRKERTAEARDGSLRVRFVRRGAKLEATILHQDEGLRGKIDEYTRYLGEAHGCRIMSVADPELARASLYLHGSNGPCDPANPVTVERDYESSADALVALTAFADLVEKVKLPPAPEKPTRAVEIDRLDRQWPVGTRAAGIASWQHWCRLAAGAKEGFHSDACALCGVFYKRGVGCDGCPIARETLLPSCCGTPWSDVSRAFKRFGQDSPEFRAVAECFRDWQGDLLLKMWGLAAVAYAGYGKEASDAK